MRGQRASAPARFWRVALTLACLLAQVLTAHAQESSPAPDMGPAQKEALWKIVQPEQELTDLLDACSAILGIAIEYNRAEVQGPITMRLTGPLSEEALWELANRALIARNLTSVQMPGSSALSVVAIAQAPSLARLERRSLAGARAGFVKVLAELSHDRTEGIAKAVELVLSKSGTVSAFKEEKALLIADLTPNVRQGLEVISRLDGPFAEMDVFEVRLAHASPTTLVALIERIVQTKKTVFGEKPQGTVLALPDARSVLVVSPAIEADAWQALVARFDRAGATSTLNYTPRRFGVDETAKLIEAVIQPKGDEPNWRMVTDELTGTLIITASADQHQAIQELFERLERTDQGPGRPIRSFTIRNRGVEELRDLLESLLSKGALKGLPEVREGAAGQVKDNFPAPPAAAQPGQEKAIQGVTGPIPDTSPTVGLSSGELGDEVILTADKPTNRLIAMGNPRVLGQLARLIEELDQRAPQVLLEAMVVNLTENQTRDLGVELQKSGASGDVQYRLASLFGFGSPDPTTTTLPPASGAGFGGVVLDPGNFSAVVRALETVNEGRSLTSPKILVNNNQPAELNSVVQTPFASTNASTTVATTSFGGTLDAGTQITLTPQIADGDQLVLDYTISLSSFVGDSADPTLPPPRQENKLKSTVTIPDGYTVVVGGLEIASDSKASSQLPLLGDLPLLGNLFASRSRTVTKTRFFVFLRASVLRSQTFEDLRYQSAPALELAGLEDGWPKLSPRIIR